MTESQKYEAKEMAKGAFASALSDYIKAADEYGYDDAEMVSEIEEVCQECGRKWSVLDV